MRQSLTVVLERNSCLTGEFATEPYEVAWAREARWFVRILELRGGARLEARTQVSPDGLVWCDLEESKIRQSSPGLATWPVREFGGWLRLKGVVVREGKAGEGVAKVLIYLALKS